MNRWVCRIFGLAPRRMKIFTGVGWPSVALRAKEGTGEKCFSTRWNFAVASFVTVLLSGCAAVPDPEPVPVGPLPGPALVAPVKAKPVPPQSFPSRSPGWDAPDPEPRVYQRPVAPKPMDAEVMRMQILIDRANFSPGCVDGRLGNQSALALRAWQRREGLSASGDLDAATRTRLPAEAEAFTSHTVVAEDLAELALVPRSWREKASMPTMAHETVLERLAEYYHVSQRALKELNPSVGWPDPAVGTILRVPKVTPSPKPLAARIEIHLAGKYMQVFDFSGKLVAHFPCSIARDKAKRPVGELHIINAASDPNYTFRPELFAEDPEAASMGQSLLIPPGPNNPVGVAWLSLDRPGYGIHGTPKPEDIGRTESHGCFRLANWNARKLLGMVTVGTPVLVIE